MKNIKTLSTTALLLAASTAYAATETETAEPAAPTPAPAVVEAVSAEPTIATAPLTPWSSE